MGLPQFAGIDVVDRLPDFRLAHAVLPAGGELAVVELEHGVGEPTGDVDAVGDVADGDFLFHPPRPEVGPHPPGDAAVQAAHGVGPPRELQPEDGHAEILALVLRFDAAEAHQLVRRNPQLVAQRPKMLFDQGGVKAVVSGGDGRVGGEDGPLGDLAEGLVETQAVVFHPLAGGFERGERTVPFIQMIDAGRDSQCPQGADAAHAGHHLLADTGAVVAAIEAAGQLAVLGAVPLDIAVQQMEVHPPDPHQPHLDEQPPGAGLDLDGDRLAVGSTGDLHREVFDLGIQVFFLLPAVDVEVLLEVALVVEQAAGH